MRRRRCLTAVFTCLPLASALVLAGCAAPSPGEQPASLLPTSAGPSATTPAPSPTGSPTQPQSPSASPHTSPPSTPTRATATAQIAAFVAAAERVDSRLRAAASAINGAVRSDRIVVTAQTAATVKAAAPKSSALWTSLPVGAPAAVRDAALLVASDLDSRYQAMHWAIWPQTILFDGPRPAAGHEHEQAGWEQIANLANGHEAAVHFRGDLARLKALAAGTPSFTPLAPSSASGLDLAVRVAAIQLHNSGCDSYGGYRYTTAFVVTQKPGHSGTVDGTVDGIAYSATLVGGAWKVMIAAC